MDDLKPAVLFVTSHISTILLFSSLQLTFGLNILLPSRLHGLVRLTYIKRYSEAFGDTR